MRKIFARHFSFDLTLILEVFSAQKKMHVQVFPVVNFNLSHPNVEPLRGKSAIEPISKKFYYVKVQLVPTYFELIREMNH